MLEFLSPHQVVTCYERVIARLYSKKTVINFICLNKEFVIVIVIVIVIHIQNDQPTFHPYNAIVFI